MPSIFTIYEMEVGKCFTRLVNHPQGLGDLQIDIGLKHCLVYNLQWLHMWNHCTCVRLQWKWICKDRLQFIYLLLVCSFACLRDFIYEITLHVSECTGKIGLTLYTYLITKCCNMTFSVTLLSLICFWCLFAMSPLSIMDFTVHVYTCLMHK